MTPITPTKFSLVKSQVPPQQALLLGDVQTILECLKSDKISDYSFIVAPAAKAYEGYLKEFFLKVGVISQEDYESDRFRVAKPSTLPSAINVSQFSASFPISTLKANS